MRSTPSSSSTMQPAKTSYVASGFKSRKSDRPFRSTHARLSVAPLNVNVVYLLTDATGRAPPGMYGKCKTDRKRPDQRHGISQEGLRRSVTPKRTPKVISRSFQISGRRYYHSRCRLIPNNRRSKRFSWPINSPCVRYPRVTSCLITHQLIES